MRRGIASAILVLATVLPVMSATPATPPAKKAAELMLQRFIESWNSADGGKYKENYWPEAELVDPTGHIVTGADAIAQEHVDLWAGPFKGSQISGEVRRVQMLGPRHMIVDLDLQLKAAKQLPPGAQLSPAGTVDTHLKHIMEKRNGQWKVISAQNTFISK